MSDENEIYENAPLVETVFEIRFPNEPAIECNRDKFYEKIRNDYSCVIVPSLVQGSTITLGAVPYKFEREDRTSAVTISIDKILISCKRYEGFRLFKKETMRIFSIFRELFKVDKLTRTGLRYINIIPFTREGNIIPITNYLKIEINLPKSISTDFKNLKMFFVSQISGGCITTRIEPVITEDQTQEVIMLDFDYAKDEGLKFNSIEEYLEESHKHTKDMFEELVTDNYRKVMCGEVV